MDWRKLLSTQRFQALGSHSGNVNELPEGHYTTSFQEDIDRIIYSSSFRRLQGKTQVHPLPNSDYYRTRLTHTIEVSSVGRLIATGIGKELLKHSGDFKFPTEVNPGLLGDIVYAACLAHDLGNPPFGHNGEYAIQSWFDARKDSYDFLREVQKDKEQRSDFQKYDGNAQGFRILTRLQGWRGDGGLQLTNAVIAAFMKYPFCSSFDYHGEKKFGYFKADEIGAKSVFEFLGIEQKDGRFPRHPLAYISEAADDICYRTTDIEDGVKKGALKFEVGKELLSELTNFDKHAKRLHYVEKNAGNQDVIAYLRSGAISSLIDAVVQQFLADHDKIMNGDDVGNLVEKNKRTETIDKIKNICNNELYVERQKMEIEAAGYNIIFYLLDSFAEVIEELLSVRGNPGNLNRKNKSLFQLLPHDNYVFVPNNRYEALLYLTDYISGMTDSYAVEMYRKLSGLDIRRSY